MQISIHFDDGPVQRFWHVIMGLATIVDGLIQALSFGFLWSEYHLYFERKLVSSRKHK